MTAKIEGDVMKVTAGLREDDGRHVLMIGQYIQHSTTHGKKTTCKHIGLAMPNGHLTGTKTAN